MKTHKLFLLGLTSLCCLTNVSHPARGSGDRDGPPGMVSDCKRVRLSDSSDGEMSPPRIRQRVEGDDDLVSTKPQERVILPDPLDLTTIQLSDGRKIKFATVTQRNELLERNNWLLLTCPKCERPCTIKQNQLLTHYACGYCIDDYALNSTIDWEWRDWSYKQILRWSLTTILKGFLVYHQASRTFREGVGAFWNEEYKFKVRFAGYKLFLRRVQLSNAHHLTRDEMQECLGTACSKMLASKNPFGPKLHFNRYYYEPHTELYKPSQHGALALNKSVNLCWDLCREINQSSYIKPFSKAEIAFFMQSLTEQDWQQIQHLSG